MKILILASVDDPRIQGGVQTFIRNITSILKNEDIKVVFEEKLKNKLIYNYEKNRLLKVGSKNIVYKIINKLLRNRLRILETRYYIKKEQPNILILNYIRQLEHLENINLKKILVQHMNYDAYIKRYCDDSKEKLKNDLEKIDYFITLSEYDKERFISEVGIKESKILSIRHMSSIEILNRKKIKNKKLIIISRIAPQKRLDLAILAMRKLPDFTLEIYGEQDTRYKENEMEKLKKLINKEKIENVFFMGGTNQVEKVLDKASIFIMTSDFEGYAITNIEAMRRGLPIILRNTYEAAQDIVVENQNGILLNKEWNEDQFVEAVYKIYDNYEYYSKKAVILGERYNKEIIEEEWQNLMNRINKK